MDGLKTACRSASVSVGMFREPGIERPLGRLDDRRPRSVTPAPPPLSGGRPEARSTAHPDGRPSHPQLRGSSRTPNGTLQ